MSHVRMMPREDERRRIANELWRYGEDGLAPRAFELTDQQLEWMGDRAGEHAVSGPPDEPGMLIDKAVALAAVEALEGDARPLARERRRPEKDSPYRERRKGWPRSLAHMRSLFRS